MPLSCLQRCYFKIHAAFLVAGQQLALSKHVTVERWEGFNVKMPFGYEYAYRPDWSGLQRIFIKMLGVVDLPTRIRARTILWALRRYPYDRVLDIGTGTGVYAFYLTRDPRCEVVALDIDEKRIEVIRYIAKQLQRYRLLPLRGDDSVLSSLPRADFSVVLAVEVLQLFPDLPRALRELHKQLRPGGVLVAHVPIREALLPDDFTLFDDSSLEKVVAEAGFEGLEIYRTFGRVVSALCEIFTWCVPRPALMVIVYPLLLLAAAVTPKFTGNGTYRLLIARRSASKVTVN